MKQSFMFIYGDMLVGGVELSIVRLIRLLRAEKKRIIWLTKKNRFVDETLKNDLYNDEVQIIEIEINNLAAIDDLTIDFEDDEEIVSCAFDISGFMQLELLKKNHPHVRMNSFYWITHFEGIFLEELIPRYLRRFAYLYLRSLIQNLNINNNLIFSSRTQLDTLSSRYDIKISEPEKKIMKFTRDIRRFDHNLAQWRSKRSRFNIITITRFDFPHKSYLIGLIRSFGRLKTKHKHMNLTIIGYGKDEDAVRNEINKLPLSISKDINIVGKVPYDGLIEYFERANVNIGVAGTICDGALTGLISIPVRHYSETCQGYGYLPESRGETGSSMPGEAIEKYIEDLILMDQERYIELSKKSYDTFATNKKISGLDVFEYKNMFAKKSIPNHYIRAFKIYKMLKKLF